VNSSSIMKSPNVIVAVPVWPEGLQRVRELVAGGSVQLVDLTAESDAWHADLALGDATVLLCEVPPANTAEMSSLEWIQLASAGYEQLRGLPLRARGVRVTNASGANDVPIAEWCITMMVLFERDLPRVLENQRRRVWDRDARFQSELRGRRVGIIGYGNVGREVGRVCRCLGLELWAMDRLPIGPRPDRYAPTGTGDPDGVLPHRKFVTDQMAEFLPHLDYLILTIPLTLATRGLIGEQELRTLPSTAVLLNPARGPLVNEAALLAALREGWIAGAALDAHYRYPLPADHPLWRMPNVILTPHISGSSAGREFLPRVWDLFADNLTRYLAGRLLLNELSLADLDSVGAF
jgi:phosphoglycerate dehydrogenase-like enzyme